MKKETQSTPFSISRVFHILMVLCLFIGTQIMLPVNIGSRTIHLYYVELFLIVLFIGVAVTMLVKRQKPRFPILMWVLPCAFLVWFFILSAYRFFAFGDLTGGFINFRVLFFPIIFFLIVKQLRIEKKDLLFSLLLFVTVMNIYQVASLFIVHSFRTVLALKNINIYLCFMLAMLPLLFFMLKTLSYPVKAVHILMQSLLVFNILCILVFSFFSGSRLNVVILPVSFFLGGMAVFGFNWRSVVRLCALCLAFIIISGTVISANLYDARYNVARTYAEIFEAIGIRIPEDSPLPDTENTDADLSTDAVDSGITQDAKTNAMASNSMRQLLWEKSVQHIKDSPFWGRTSIDIEIEMMFAGATEPVKVIQSPHNFILEIWLALGLPGLILYGVILLTVMLSILRKQTRWSGRIMLLTILFSLFGFSFFQPLVTCYFAISFLLWLVLYLFEGKTCDEILSF